MRRYWVPKESLNGEEVFLRGDVLHHIRDVCRMRLGSKFEVIIEGRGALLVEVISEKKHESVARIIEARSIPELPKPFIHLALSMPRFPVFEAVVEKSVELGVKAIHPFFSDYSFIRTQDGVFTKKRARFEKIVIGATQQSGRGDLMPIREPVALDEVLQTFNRDGASAGLFAYEGAHVLTAKQGVQKLKDAAPQDVWVFVGSEGGFSEKEVRLFAEKGLQAVTIGNQVLRVETACVALISILKYDLDLMR